MADVSDFFLVINDVIMTPLLLLKVIHMLATFLIFKIPSGAEQVFFALCVYLDFQKPG